jgi:hypothetical protein
VQGSDNWSHGVEGFCWDSHFDAGSLFKKGKRRLSLAVSSLSPAKIPLKLAGK